MTDFASLITQTVRDAAWLPHRYDPGHDAVHFQHVPRDVHRKAVFATDEHLPADAEKRVLRREDVIGAVPDEAPMHFIFHSAFCCSTLLARVFDRPGWAMGLKEPVILNDLVGWRRRGGDPRTVAMVLDHSLRLLGRPFDPGEAIVIKPSNIVNSLATAMLAMRPSARALLLHAPLPTYLTSVAKKGMQGRLWVRDGLVGMLQDGSISFGFDQKDYLGQTDLQVAAIGWLAQHAIFAGLIARFGPDRVRSLDSETLLARREDAVRALTAHYGMPLTEADLSELAHGPVFHRHSKLGTDFASTDRNQEYRDAASAHGDEIDKVVRWAMAVAESAGVPMVLDSPLVA
uniref:hypothetical protein n=1 Tax=Edaphosphingomonas laterariae TaxID=861865 RepID=UPI001FE9BD8A|nr:hypothetical protein [Sphingomonas laterariae]